MLERTRQVIRQNADRFGRSDRSALRIGIGIFWILGIGLLAGLVWAKWPEIYPFLDDVRPGWFAAAFLAFGVTITTATFGWSVIMRPFSPSLDWGLHGRIYAVTLVARRLPGTLWYIGGRLVLYQRLGIKKTFVGFASGLEIAVIIVTGLILGGIFLSSNLPLSSLSSWIIFAGLIAAAFTFAAPGLIAWLARRKDIRLEHVPSFLDVTVWLLAFAATWAAGGLLVFFTVRAFHDLAWTQFGYVLGAWALSGALGTLTIFLPSSFGVAEISLSILLAQILPLPLAAVVAITTRLLTILFDFIVAALLYPLLKRDRALGLGLKHDEPPGE